MGTLVNLQQIATEIQGYQIQAPVDMFTALQYVSENLTNTSYTGSVSNNRNGTDLVYQLLINNVVNNTSAVALVGDYIIIKNNALVSVCKSSDFASLYATTQ
jgi:hypothetical protein